LEIDAENLPLILKTIMAGDKSYSDNIKNAISDIWNNDLLADEINRQIILLLSKGYKVRDIAGKVGLSSSGIQKRLNKIEKQFEVENEKDLIKKIFDDKLLVGIDM
jgi:DNA-binding NarL/FixJ family response regulator